LGELFKELPQSDNKILEAINTAAIFS